MISFWARSGGGRAPAGTDHQDQLATGHGADQTFDEGGADEPGGTGDGDSSPRERLGDHGDDVYHSRLPFGREPLAVPVFDVFVSPLPAIYADFGDTNRGRGRSEGVAAGDVGVELGARLRRAQLGVVVDPDDAEALAVSERPLEVVEQRPCEVAPQIDALFDRCVRRGEMVAQVLDAARDRRPRRRGRRCRPTPSRSR